VVAVAITRLAKHEGSISLFVRYVKNYFAFYSLHIIPPGGARASVSRTVNVWNSQMQATGQGCQARGYTRWS
jgi:hypothetical protein